MYTVFTPSQCIRAMIRLMFRTISVTSSFTPGIVENSCCTPAVSYTHLKTAEIKAAVNDGKAFLAICGGYQMLGNYYKTWDGEQCDFTGALDLYTIGCTKRLIGNYMFTCDDLPGQTVVGFENHAGKTYLGSGVRPMGRVLAGYGNNGEDLSLIHI